MIGRILVASAIAALAGMPLAQAQQVGTVPNATVAPAEVPSAAPNAKAAAAASGPKVYLADRIGKLGTLDLGNGAVKVIGSMGTPMTDIAFCPNGTLYAITFTKLYRVNASTAKATLVGSHGASGLNALVCNSANQLLAHSDTQTRLYRLNGSNARATLIGSTGSFKSAGDLSYHEGALFLTSKDKKLVKLNKTTGAVLSSKTHGITDLFGLVSTGTNKLYGFAGTKAYKLNEDNGGKTQLFSFAGKGLQQIYGAAYKGNFQQ